MSIHPSLSLSDKNKKSRSVLKRTERLRIMMEKGQWKEKDKVFGLPKIKTVRIRIKKEKVKEAVEAAVAEVTTGEAAAPAGAEPKEQTPTKGPATKGQEKK